MFARTSLFARSALSAASFAGCNPRFSSEKRAARYFCPGLQDLHGGCSRLPVLASSSISCVRLCTRSSPALSEPASKRPYAQLQPSRQLLLRVSTVTVPQRNPPTSPALATPGPPTGHSAHTDSLLRCDTSPRLQSHNRDSPVSLSDSPPALPVRHPNFSRVISMVCESSPTVAGLPFASWRSPALIFPKLEAIP
jgi:hypothetical protein